MADEAQDKQHSATGKHLSELRKRGNVMRSRDLSGGLIFVVAIVMLFVMSDSIRQRIENNFILSFTNFKQIILQPDYLIFILKSIFIDTFYQLLPLFIVVILVAFLSPFVFGGWNFTLDVIQFKLTKLNPTNNLGKIFAPKQALIEIIRSMIKSNFFLLVLVLYFLSAKDDILNLINEPANISIYSSYLIIKNFIIILSASLIFIVMFDVLYHYFKYQEQAKMSTQEVKDEHKEMEGNPEAKRKLRLKQLALVMQRLSQSVPKANVIITNPTHYSIALKYDSTKDHAPKVVAKGKGIVAQQIKKIAIANAITIYEAPELARAIYYTTKVGMPIHPALYKAVAIVLSYVYQLKKFQMGAGVQPEFIMNLEIPKEFIYRE